MQPLVYKQALREFEVLERFEAGVVLMGSEVKSIRDGRLIFIGSFVKFVGSELYWINAEIPLYKHSRLDGYEPRRSRKLLLHRKEMTRLISKIKARPGLTIVPLKCYTKGSHLKLEIALSKGKKAHEIKSVEKARAIARDDKRMTKEYLKG